MIEIYTTWILLTIVINVSILAVSSTVRYELISWSQAYDLCTFPLTIVARWIKLSLKSLVALIVSVIHFLFLFVLVATFKDLNPFIPINKINFHFNMCVCVCRYSKNVCQKIHLKSCTVYTSYVCIIIRTRIATTRFRRTPLRTHPDNNNSDYTCIVIPVHNNPPVR